MFDMKKSKSKPMRSNQATHHHHTRIRRATNASQGTHIKTAAKKQEGMVVVTTIEEEEMEVKEVSTT